MYPVYTETPETPESMQIRFTSLKILLIGISLLHPFHVKADMAMLGGTLNRGNVYRVDNPNIQMVREKIQVDVVASDEAFFQINYIFKNLTDQPQKVTMGFPEFGEAPSEPRLKNFTILIDGKSVTPRTVDNTPAKYWTPPSDADVELNRWYTTTVDFLPFQEIAMINTYTQQGKGGEGHSTKWVDFYYILETGGSWANNIEQIDWEINLSPGPWTIDKLRYLYFSDLSHTTLERREKIWHFNKDTQQITASQSNVKPGPNDNLHLRFSASGYDLQRFVGPQCQPVVTWHDGDPWRLYDPSVVIGESMAAHQLDAALTDNASTWLSQENVPLNEQPFFLEEWCMENVIFPYRKLLVY